MSVALLLLGLVVVAAAGWAVALAWARVEALEAQIERNRSAARSARLAVIQGLPTDALRHLDSIAPRRVSPSVPGSGSVPVRG